MLMMSRVVSGARGSTSSDPSLDCAGGLSRNCGAMLACGTRIGIPRWLPLDGDAPVDEPPDDEPREDPPDDGPREGLPNDDPDDEPPSDDEPDEGDPNDEPPDEDDPNDDGPAGGLGALAADGPLGEPMDGELVSFGCG